MTHGLATASTKIALLVFAATTMLSGCLDPPPGKPFPTPTLASPTWRLPTVAGPTYTGSGTVPSIPSGSVDPRGKYPLTLAEAQGLAGAGYIVAGSSPNGEVQVQRATVTEWEYVTKSEQVCKDRWDAYEGKNKYSCKFETVQERDPITKTKFYVSGPGMSTVAYDTVAQAFSRIAPTNYWRRLT